MSEPLALSIIIKALNEERNIAGAIESALAALEGYDGEVILADSASTDRTVEIACRYPIRVVTLEQPSERSCGIGAQLGYQHSRGDFVCIIDGDMRLHRGFLEAALAVMAREPRVAGVGGLVLEQDTSNVEFEARQARDEPDRRAGSVSRLDCGGLYRREAIEAVGYFTDRNLHGGEELDLGARLHAAGWSLTRIDRPAIDHYGHSGGDFRLLLRRFRNKTAFAAGEVFRASFGRAHFPLVFRNNNGFTLCLIVHLWWLTILATPFLIHGWLLPVALATLVAFPFVAMGLKWRSIRYAAYAVSAWNLYAVCFWFGLLRRRVRPDARIASRILADAVPSRRSSSQIGLRV